MTVLSDEPASGTSTNKALILQFKHPLRRIGFTLESDTKNTTASFRAFTVKGELLGPVEQIGTDEKQSPSVGLETSHPGGISTLVVDYGTAEAAEQIDNLRIEYLSVRPFKVYLPQIAHGKGGDLFLETTLQIQNLFAGGKLGVNVKLTLFDQQGKPLSLGLDGETGSQFEFTLPFLGLRQLTTGGPASGLAAGYACIESDHP